MQAISAFNLPEPAKTVQERYRLKQLKEPTAEKTRSTFTREQQLDRLIEKNPAIKKMIDTFGLVLQL